MKVRHSTRFWLAMPLALLAAGGLAGCGSSSPPPASGGGGTGGSAPAPSGGSGGGGGSPGGPDAAGPDAPTAAGPLTTYRTCKDGERVGDFELALNDMLPDVAPFTGLSPTTVFDWVTSASVPEVAREMGGCRIVRPPRAMPPCSPECPPDKRVCTPGGCRADPIGIDVGNVAIEGLKVAGTLSKRDDFVYTNPSWPHPAFDEGADLVLRASGAGATAPFTLRGWGVGSLSAPKDKLLVENGKPVTLTWTPPARPGPTRVLISFSINRHGSVDASLECEVPDTGSHTIDAATVSELFRFDISGYPSVDLKRQSSDTATIAAGCVEFNVSAAVNREITIPGLVSCPGDPEPGQPNPCPQGQSCGVDLRCQ